MKTSAVILCYLLVVVPACRTVPPATAQERSARDQWAALVSPVERQTVYDEAARHTDWGEKRKIRFEIERFEHILREQQHKPRTTQPASKPA